MNVDFTLRDVQLLNADLRSTEARPQLASREPDDDRALRLSLKGSVLIGAFRRKAAVLSQALAAEFGLAHLPLPRVTKDDERIWRSKVASRLLRAAFRRRRSRTHNTTPPRAA